MIGLGLADGDIPLNGLNALKKSDRIYAEFYTSKNIYDLDKIEDKTGKQVQDLDREQVEGESEVLSQARSKDVSFLVPGDPLSGTTHYEIFYRAKKENLEVEVFHAPSIFTAISQTGLSLYKFGRVTTLPLDQKPRSVYDLIQKNHQNSLHSLILLDIDLKAQSALKKINEIEKRIGPDETLFSPDQKVILLKRLGTSDQRIIYSKVSDLLEQQIGGEVPQSLIKPSELDHKEEQFVELYCSE